jgi:dihydrofolate reductase
MFNDRAGITLIVGSGTIVSQFTDAGLIDEYQVVVNAIVLGEGSKMLSGIKEKLCLRSERVLRAIDRNGASRISRAIHSA